MIPIENSLKLTNLEENLIFRINTERPEGWRVQKSEVAKRDPIKRISTVEEAIQANFDRDARKAMIRRK